MQQSESRPLRTTFRPLVLRAFARVNIGPVTSDIGRVPGDLSKTWTLVSNRWTIQTMTGTRRNLSEGRGFIQCEESRMCQNAGRACPRLGRPVTPLVCGYGAADD